MEGGLSIAMLGWKAHETTRKSFKSWVASDLVNCGDEFFAFFNQVSDADRALAAEYGIACCGSPDNLGIWRGKEAILERAKGDYVVFLDNDHEALVSRDETHRWISSALDLLKAGKADSVILLNRFERLPGWGSSHFFDYHFIHELDPRAERCLGCCPPDWNRDTFRRKLHRLFRPFAARRRLNGAAPYLERHPDALYPKYIAKEGDFYILDSAIQPYCDAPIMTSRAFFGKISAWARRHPGHRTILGFPEMEYALNSPWWRRRHFKTAVCDGGIFGHRRIDDSWRSYHAEFNGSLVTDGWKK